MHDYRIGLVGNKYIIQYRKIFMWQNIATAHIVRNFTSLRHHHEYIGIYTSMEDAAKELDKIKLVMHPNKYGVFTKCK